MTEAWPWRPSSLRSTDFRLSFVPVHKWSRLDLSCGCQIRKTRSFHHEGRSQHVNCLDFGNQSSSSDDDDGEQGPPQEVVLKAISGLILCFLYNYLFCIFSSF